jgi:hypothetical protein
MKRQLAIAVLLAVAAAGSVSAQVVYGSIRGTVTDDSGAVVAGAKVTVRNLDTGLAKAVESNGAGLYLAGDIRPGRYEVQASAPGFATFVQQGITVRIEDHPLVDIVLHLGGVSERVVITAEAPLLQSEQTTLGKVVEEREIQDLPMLDRDVVGLVMLVPGVQAKSDDEQPRISGGRARTGEMSVDGSSITSPRRGEFNTRPNMDAVQEINVQTNGLSAEYGRTAGGVINAALKSGANRYHGELFEFFRNDKLNARNFFAATAPKLRQNQFGGMLGGPIRKDRTFFFISYDTLQRRGQSIFNITVPTPPLVAGDFSSLLGARAGTDALGRNVLTNQIYDPATTRTVSGREVRDPFAGNIVPVSRFDPAGKKLLDIYPAPTEPGNTLNYRVLKPSGNHNHRINTRLDQRFSDKDVFFAYFAYDRQYSDIARPFRYASSGGRLHDENRFKSGSVNWARSITPTTVADTRFAFFRGYEDRIFDEMSPASALGIPNLGPTGVPSLSIGGGYAAIGDSVIRSPAQEQYQIQHIVTLVRGRHIVKAGADVRRFRVNDLQLQANGTYSFSTVQTGDPFSGRGGNVLGSVLLGQVNNFSNDPNRGRFYQRSSYLGWFLQDDFKVTSRLTLNLGVRYEMEQQPSEIRWNGSNFDLKQGRVITMRELGRDRIQFADKNNFEPRVGFAWRPFAKTVIRSHYGIFYTPLTGRATTAFDRFPQDRVFQVSSDGVNPSVILSKTPPVPEDKEGYQLAHEFRDPNASAGYFQQWNFDIQRQMPLGILAQASYSASIAKHLPMTVNYNQIRIETARAAAKGTQDMRPYPQFGGINGQDDRGSSNYQSLQLVAQRRYRKGLSFLVGYTFSKLIDDVEDVFGATPLQDSYNLRLEKSLSAAHYPHRFVGSGVYELPVGKGKRLLGSGTVSRLIGNWQLGWIVALQSGSQVTITQSSNTTRTFNGGLRPNLVSNPILPEGERTLNRWFNTQAFQAPAPFYFGTSGSFPNIQGPGLATTDLSLKRYVRLPMNEVSRFEIRGECFNCFNRVNFQEPTGTLGSSSFGRVSAANAARAMQVALKFWF